MDDVSAIATFVTTVSIVMGVVFALMELRHLTGTRKKVDSLNKKRDEKIKTFMGPAKTEARTEANRQLGVIQDFYSARAVAHASYFVATIFGLFAVITSVEAYPLKSSGYWPWIKALLAIAFLFVFLLGFYCFMNFSYYSNLAQRAEHNTAKDAEEALFGGEEVETSVIIIKGIKKRLTPHSILLFLLCYIFFAVLLAVVVFILGG